MIEILLSPFVEMQRIGLIFIVVLSVVVCFPIVALFIRPLTRSEAVGSLLIILSGVFEGVAFGDASAPEIMVGPIVFMICLPISMVLGFVGRLQLDVERSQQLTLVNIMRTAFLFSFAALFLQGNKHVLGRLAVVPSIQVGAVVGAILFAAALVITYRQIKRTPTSNSDRKFWVSWAAGCAVSIAIILWLRMNTYIPD